MNKTTNVLLFALLIGAAALRAGDGNPFAPKQVTIDLDFRSKSLSEYKFQQARLIIVFKPIGGQNYGSDMEYAPIRSLTIDLGTGKLSIPEPVLERMRLGGYDLKFMWFAHGYNLSFDGSFLEGNEWKYGEFRFRWEKGVLIQAFHRRLIDRDTVEHKDLTVLFPELFPARKGPWNDSDRQTAGG